MKRHRIVARRRKEAPAPDTKAVVADRAASADAIDRAIVDEFEDAPAGMMKSKDIRPLVRGWFERQGLEPPPDAVIWEKMRERFKHDPNNNRPRYLGLKPRAKMGPRIVVNNQPAAP